LVGGVLDESLEEVTAVQQSFVLLAELRDGGAKVFCLLVLDSQLSLEFLLGLLVECLILTFALL
jgi:hypothetical protein